MYRYKLTRVHRGWLWFIAAATQNCVKRNVVGLSLKIRAFHKDQTEWVKFGVWRSPERAWG